jgi:hypothetical protein
MIGRRSLTCSFRQCNCRRLPQKDLTVRGTAGCSSMRNGISFLGVIGLAAALILSETSCSKPGNDQSTTEQSYTLGKKVIFGEAGDSERYRVSGWSHTEKEITWTEGNSAVLQFAGVPAATSLRLKMTLSGFVRPPDLPSQPVELWVNDKKVTSWQVVGKAEFSALVPPRDSSTSDTLKMELKTPKATSPKTLGVSDDPRVLGVCCFDLVLNKVE